MKKQTYKPKFKKQLVRLHLEEGRTISSPTEESTISSASVSNWVNQYRKECQSSPKENYNMMKENRRLRKELKEIRKENDFLKKAVAFFAREIE